MRVLILGGNGMLGHQLLISFQDKYEVKVTLKNALESYKPFGIFNSQNSICNLDVLNYENLGNVISNFNPDIVINCIGIIKQREEVKDKGLCIEINSLFPHKLKAICDKFDVKMIHMSTDCVFSGNKGHYKENDIADAKDFYGRSKYLGELSDNNLLTIRTSILGLELIHKKSLIEWFLSQSGEVKGFCNAIYSGLTTFEMARIISSIIDNHQGLTGLLHVSSMPISKYKLLTMLADNLELTNVRVVEEHNYYCDRSLDSTLFSKFTGYIAPAWELMIEELALNIKNRIRGLV